MVRREGCFTSTLGSKEEAMNPSDVLLCGFRRMDTGLALGLGLVWVTLLCIVFFIGRPQKGEGGAGSVNTWCALVYCLVTLGVPVLLLVAGHRRALANPGQLAVLFLFFVAMQILILKRRFSVRPRLAISLAFSPWLFGLVEHWFFGGGFSDLAEMAFEVAVFSGFVTFNAFWLTFPLMLMGKNPLGGDESPFRRVHEHPVRTVLAVLVILLLLGMGAILLHAVWQPFLVFELVDGGTPLVYLLVVIAIQVGIEAVALRKAGMLE